MASINDYIDSINLSIESIDNNKKEITDADLPSDFKLLFGTMHPDNKFLQLIFDTKLDKTIDNLLNNIINGNFDVIDKYAKIMNSVFETLGIGKGAFSGPVSQTIMSNLMHSLNTIDVSRTKSKIQAAMLVVRNLKKQKKYIDDPEVRKKYMEGVHALKQTVRFISKVYKDRRILTNRVKDGLRTIVNEDYDYYKDLDYDLNLLEE